MTFRRQLAVIVLCLACAGLPFGSAALAGSNTLTGRHPVHPPAAYPPSSGDSGYYVEFRARPTGYFGHSYVQVGRLGKDGHRLPATTAGLYPDPKRAHSIFDAPGAIGYTDPDIRSQPSIKYRLSVSKQTYRQAEAFIVQMSRTPQRYDLIGHNCNHLTGHVARRLGLTDPGEHADTPANYVRALEQQNGGRSRASWR